MLGIVDGRMPARRLAVACLLVASAPPALVRDAAATTAPSASIEAPISGVSIRRLRLPGPVSILVMRVDPAAARIEVVAARPRRGGSTTLGHLSARYNAAIAVNGDLARDGRPAHLLIHGGRLVTSGDAAGAAIALDPTGVRASLVVDHPEIRLVRLDTGDGARVARWNAGDGPGRQLAVFASRSAPLTTHPSTCAAWLRPTGDRRDGRFVVTAAGCGMARRAALDEVVAVAPKAGRSGSWLREVRPGVPVILRVETGLPVTGTAFGGMPMLVHRGRVVATSCGPLTCAEHPRTAAGVTAGCLDRSSSTGCRVVLVVVDGRRAGWSLGMTTDRLARLMRRLGAVEAVNLDGGASSQIILDGRTVNRVAPGARRAVVSALLVEPPPEIVPAPMPAGRRELP